MRSTVSGKRLAALAAIVLALVCALPFTAFAAQDGGLAAATSLQIQDETDISGAKITIGSQVYTGSAITPEAAVELDGNVLEPDVDYTLSFANNVNIGTATVTATGMGAYSGTASATFKITKAPASQMVVNKIPNKTYTGAAKTPSPTIYFNGTKLKKGTDYTLSYKYNVNSSAVTGRDAQVTVKGIGNFKGEQIATFTILKAEASKMKVNKIPNKTYTGAAKTPSPYVYFNGKKLNKGTDYTLSYKYNKNASSKTGKKAQVIVKGVGNFKDTKTVTFTILKAEASKMKVNKIPNKTYTESLITPSPYVYFNGKKLKKGTDYTLSYKYNRYVRSSTAAKAPRVIVKGIGNFKGKQIATFSIVKASITKASVSDIPAYTYTGNPIRPNVVVRFNGKTLAEGKAYKLNYSNNTNAGQNSATVIITGIGNFKGTKRVAFTINKADLDKASLGMVGDQTYTGDLIRPNPMVTYNGKRLQKDIDYILDFDNNENVGIAKISITGIKNFTGLRHVTFNIKPRSIQSGYVPPIDDQIYTGNPIRPYFTLSVNGKLLQLNRDYSVYYSNNIYVGTATLILEGMGNYTGQVYPSPTFRIVQQQNNNETATA